MNKLGRFAAACAAVLCAFGASAATLGEYRNYVETDGDGSTAKGVFVTLDYIPTWQTVVEVKLKDLARSTTTGLFCSRTGNGKSKPYDNFACICPNGSYRWDYGTIVTTTTASPTDVHTVTCRPDGLYVNGVQKLKTTPKDVSTEPKPVHKLVLFGAYNGVADDPEPVYPPANQYPSSAHMQVYSVKIWDDNGATPKYDLRPCVDTDGKAAFYDTIGKRLYYGEPYGTSQGLIASVEKPPYTWTGGGDGTSWEDPANWDRTDGDYPKSAEAVVQFTADKENAAVISEDLSLSSLQIAANAQVTIKSAAGGARKLTVVKSLGLPGGNGTLILDGTACVFDDSVNLASGDSLVLKNAASFYCAFMELSNSSESAVTLSGRSYLETSGRLQVYKYGTLTIDDSTLLVRDSCYLGEKSTGGGTVVFKGASPVLSCRNQFRASGDDAKCTADFNLNFEIPLGGFKDVPIQLPNAKAFDSMSKCPSKYIFYVLETSPALLAGTKLAVPVVIAKNGAVDARMAAGSGAALATTTYDGAAATADADRKVTHLVVNPSSEEVQTPVVVETTRINEWLRSSVTASAGKNGRQIQPNLFVTMLANDGTTTRVTLEGGTENDPSTFTDGPLAATISSVGFVDSLASLYWEAPKGVFQECFVRYRIDQLDAGGNVVATAYSDVFSNTTHDNATYTWQAVNGVWDGNVNDRAHWKSSAGEDDRNDYPSDINSRPVFPKNCTATVTIPETLPFGRLSFNTENADITFVSAGGDTNIVLQAYEFNMDSNAKSRFTLDHTGFSVASGTVTLGARHEFRILHSYFKCTSQMRINSQSSTTANQGTNVQFLMDDSECYFESSFTIGNRQTRAVIRNSRVSVDTVCFGYHLAGGTLRFEGDHPVLTVRGGGFRSDTDNTTPTLEFVVPEGGYQELPLQLTKNPSVCFLSNNSKTGYAATVRISPDSPILFTDFNGDIPLVDWWTKGIQLAYTTYDANTEGATFIFSDASEYAGGTFNWTEEKSGTPKAMGVRIAGTPRTADSLLVTGHPNLNLTASPTPAYGLTTGHAVGEPVSIKAPAQINDDDAKISAVCTGYRVYAGETLVREVVFDKDSSREAVLSFPDDPQGLKLVWTWDSVVYSLDKAVYFVSNSGTWRMKDESGAEMMGGTCMTTLNAAIDAAPDASIIYVKNDYDCSVDTPKNSEGKGGNCMYRPGKLNTIRSESGDWRTGPALYGRKLSTTVTGAGAQAIRVFCRGGSGSATTGPTVIGFKIMNGAAGGTGTAEDDAMAGAGGLVRNAGKSTDWATQADSFTFKNCLLAGGAGGLGGAAFKCVLENCVISNNLANTGGGCYRCKLIDCTVVTNVTFRTNVDTGAGVFGGFAVDSRLIGNCSTNVNSSGGGAANAALTNCIVRGNFATSNGGGIVGGTSVNCIVCDNVSLRNGINSGGGGICSGTHYNALVYGNTSGNKGGGACDGTYYNCTFTGNEVVQMASGDGNHSGGVEGGTFVNCISWGNGGEDDVATVASNCCLKSTLVSSDGHEYVDCINSDPRLDATCHSLSSRCKNRGLVFEWMTDPEDARAKDLEGNPRLFGEYPDLGCFERQFTPGLLLMVH